MNIRIGNYRISMDEYQFIVSEIKTREKGSKKGTEYDTNFTYHISMEQAIDKILKHRLSKSNITTLMEFKTELKQYQLELRDILLKCKMVNEND